MPAAAPLHVLFATAELSPIASVGGLAAAAAGLVKELRRQGVDVEVVLPDYGGCELANEETSVLDVPEWVGGATVRRGSHGVVGDVTLVTVEGMARPHPYVQPDGQGWEDNDRRFFAFSAAVAALGVERRPDVVHLNDWHTALAAGLLAHTVPVVLTIHTLGYQGYADPGWVQVLAPAFRADFSLNGATNPLVGAIRTADRVIAVSPNYAAEIVTPRAGNGIDNVLRAAGPKLVGVLNGIDTELWNPAADEHIPAAFSAKSVTKRAASRSALLAECGFPDDGAVLISMVTRLVDQKGVDLLIECVPYLRRMGARLMVLGSGDAALVEALEDTAALYPDDLWFRDGYDVRLSHLLFAGADLFAMPSRFEPCGLAQMQALRYGCLPVVTPVGGLVDTVIDLDEHPDTGTGVVAADVSVTSLIDALHRGARAVRDRRTLAAARKRAMTHDWSWTIPARHHVELYTAMLPPR